MTGHRIRPRNVEAGRVAPLLAALLLLAVGATGASATAAAVHRHPPAKRPKITLAQPPAAAAGSRLVATGAISGAPRGAAVTLQALAGAAWIDLGRGKVDAGAYRIGFEVPAGRSSVMLRSLLVQRHRTVARSPMRTLRVLGHGDEVRRTGGGAAGPQIPGTATNPQPERRQPIPVTAAATVVKVGSAVRLAVPAPFTSITALGPPVDSKPGLRVAAEGGGLAVSASAAAEPGASVLHAIGSGCTETECGLELALTVPVTVTGLPAPPGPLDEFTEPSPDRIGDAVGDALADELLITLGTTQQPGTRAEAETDAGAVEGVLAGGIDAIGVYEIRWAGPQDLGARRAILEGLPGVAAVSSYGLDEYTADLATPSIAPDFDQPWWIWPYEQIEAGKAWSLASGSPVTVGVIDGGNVFAAHEDLHVAETIPTGTGPELHATHVAGLACARGDNQVGMTGMEPGCPLVSYGIGGIRGFFAHVLEGMTAMAERPAVKVVNVSLGENAERACATEFEAAQFQAHAEDAAPMFRRLLAGIGSSIVWTFSAGNNCAPGIPSPWGQSSDLPNVIVVGATNSDGSLASFSDYGRRINVAAPGGVETEPSAEASNCAKGALCFGRSGLLSSAVSCTPKCAGGYAEDAGTSMSAPLVAGVAALVRSTDPSLSAGDAGECIKLTAGIETGYASAPSSLPAGYTPRFSVPGAPALPIVNAAAAVECARPDSGGTGPPAGPEVVSVDYAGVARNGRDPRISRDGRYVWFESEDNLVPGIRLESTAVYIRDLLTKTTRRIDLPGVDHSSTEQLLAISPSGRYGLLSLDRNIRYVVDQQTGTVTQVQRFLGYANELGLEDDGDTVLKSPSEPAPGSQRGNVADLYSISKDQWTSLPCPIERYNREDFATVNLDNDGFAAVSSLGCRTLASGYLINLATNSVSEVLPGLCFNGGNACVDNIATNESGSAFLAALCCANLNEDSLDFDGRSLLTSRAIQACGVSESGRYAIYSSAGVIGVYDDQTKQTRSLTESPANGALASCWRQSVTADGTVVYQREPEADWEGTQILLAHP